MHLIKIAGLLILLMNTACAVSNERYSDRAEVRQFVKEVSKKHKLNHAELMRLFRDVKVQEEALIAISKPAEQALSWDRYRKIFIKEGKIAGGVKFWAQWNDALVKAEQEFGVPAEIIVAIVGVEANYGSVTGRFPVLDTLTTLGFDYPPRGKFFRSELEQFLLLVSDERIDPVSVKGSYAGAMGMPQFISSSYRHYAVDFDNDGQRNLWTSTVDVIGSVANYFKKHGWQTNAWVTEAVVVNNDLSEIAAGKGRQGLKPEKTINDYYALGVVERNGLAKENKATLLLLDGEYGNEYWLFGNNFYAITRYNQSSMYAMAVYQLSQEIKNRYTTIIK